MQGIHEGTGAKLLPTLLAAIPSSSPVLLYTPRPRSTACTLCTVVYSLLPVLPAFLSNCLTHRHNCTQSAFSNSKRSHLQLPRWRLYMDVSLCVFFFLPLYALAEILFFILFFPIVCFLSVYSRLHVWMRNTTTQTNILFLHSSLFIC